MRKGCSMGCRPTPVTHCVSWVVRVDGHSHISRQRLGPCGSHHNLHTWRQAFKPCGQPSPGPPDTGEADKAQLAPAASCPFLT